MNKNICLKKLKYFLLLVVFLMNSFFVHSVDSAEFLPTTVEVLVSCGDGIAEAVNGEACDPGEPPAIPQDVGSSTCQSFNDVFGNPYQVGTLSCLADCSDFNIGLCHTCGNNDKEPIEECDGNDFNDKTCLTFGFDGGALLCTTNCKISTTNCEAREHEGGTPGSGGGSHGGGSGTASNGVTDGYDPGEYDEYQSKVVINGKSYPYADVHILVDGKVIGIVKADARANFYFETTEVSPGVVGFGFWSEDKDSLKSTLLTLTFRVSSGAVTTISGVYIAPSIDVDSQNIKQGDKVKIFGQTVPETKVEIYIHSEEEHKVEASSTPEGNWELYFDTTPLEEDFHTAKSLFTVASEGNVIKSGFSKSVSFYVGKVGGVHPCPEADLNHDKRVNLTDFSMLLYNWGKDNICADQNQNGTVDLIDFSIMMYYWTG